MSIVSLPRMAAGVACLLMLAASPAFAQDKDDSTSDSGHKHGPPGRGERGQEIRKALADACADSSEGDDCKVDFDEHTLEGTCATSERTNMLFCRPAHPPMRAAFEACKDKSQGDDCSFARRQGEDSVDGSCEMASFPHRMHRPDDGDGQHAAHTDRGDRSRDADADADGDHAEKHQRPLVCRPDRDDDGN